MSRRVKRELARLERIHRRRLREQADRLRACVEHDTCERMDCQYFPLTEDVLEILDFVGDILGEEGASACASTEGAAKHGTEE